jgi:hypothetical protein
MTGPVAYWHVEDIKETSKLLLDAGAEAQQAINEEAGLPMTPPPRTRQQRKQDALNRLERATDAWVATADRGSGTP